MKTLITGTTRRLNTLTVKIKQSWPCYQQDIQGKPSLSTTPLVTMTVQQTETTKDSHKLWCKLMEMAGILLLDLTTVRQATELLMHGRSVQGLEYQDASHESENKGIS